MLLEAVIPSHLPPLMESSLVPVMDLLSLPPFGHIPPPSVIVVRRCPLSLETQAFPLQHSPALMDVLLWVLPYLHLSDNVALRKTA
jgi:hypothetical protein